MTRQDRKDVLQLVHVFDAPIETVFAAWTQREEWQAWLGPQGVRCEISRLEAKVGGQYKLTMLPESGAPIPVAGRFQIVERPYRLAFTWGYEGDALRQSLITLSFRSLSPDKTELTLRQEGLRSKASRDAHAAGWKSAFQKLTSHLAPAIPSLLRRPNA